MLNHPDYVVTAIVFPYGSEDPWAVKIKYSHLRTGKLSEGLFTGKADYLRVSEQCRKQITARHYVSVSHEPKPKRAAPAPTPIGKVKGKKK